jgi:hypothetical protein
MTNRVVLTAAGESAAELRSMMAGQPGLQVVDRTESERLALDQSSVSLIVGGLGTVNAFIAALVTVWIAKVKKPASELPTVQLRLWTDSDEIHVTVDRSGTVIETRGTLPTETGDVTHVHLMA